MGAASIAIPMQFSEPEINQIVNGVKASYTSKALSFKDVEKELRVL